MYSNYDLDYLNPNDFSGPNDSSRIQAAIDEARKSGVGKVLIPKRNKAAGTQAWVISETILVPSSMTIILDNCYMVMADGVYCNMFKNSNARTPAALKPDGEENRIIIKGIGNAVLDGGKPNNFTEYNDIGNILNNTMINLHNVSDFIISDISIINPRYWGITCIFARRGRISNIVFGGMNTVPNQDGIDLRVGCSDITIENITGYTGDDTVALTALKCPIEKPLLVDGASTDIHNIIIKNIRTHVTSQSALVRLLNHDGNRIYNVVVDTIIDASPENKPHRLSAAIKIGENFYSEKFCRSWRHVWNQREQRLFAREYSRDA